MLIFSFWAIVRIKNILGAKKEREKEEEITVRF
jgi:hypothetical protein